MKNLERVIEEEASKIRETDLSSNARFRTAWLKIKSKDKGTLTCKASVIIDELGRVRVPEPWSTWPNQEVKAVSLDHKVYRKVIRTEDLFNGTDPVTLVCYLEET